MRVDCSVVSSPHASRGQRVTLWLLLLASEDSFLALLVVENLSTSSPAPIQLSMMHLSRSPSHHHSVLHRCPRPGPLYPLPIL